MNLVSSRKADCGAILLEVVLALGLFVAAAAVVSTGLSSSSDGVERQRLQLHAANLAGSVLAELELGARPVATDATQFFEPPFTNWTWELVLTPVESELGEVSGLTRVEVVVRHQEPPVTHRLAQWLNLAAVKAATRPANPLVP